MTFAHGSSTQVLANEVLVSSQVSGWTMTWSRQVSEVTCVGQTPGAAGSNFVPGLQAGNLGLRGPHQRDSTTGLTPEIVQAIGVDNSFLCTCLPDGYAIGKPSFFMVGDPTEFAVDATVAEAVSMTMSAQADEAVEMGWVLAPLQAYTADQLAGTAVDRGAAPLTPTTGGLAASMHITAYSGFTGVAVKVQHSPDNAAWSDLATFANVTAVGWQKINVPMGTTVNRYLRASIDVTGSGSVTLLVSAAPR